MHSLSDPSWKVSASWWLSLYLKLLAMASLPTAASPATEEAFQYSALEDGEIRLLRVLEPEADRTRCRIQHFPSACAPPHTALSYTWGDLSRKCPITANGKRLDVTQNLQGFFLEIDNRRQRAQDSTGWPYGWLWIDALCINQGDPIERSEQVARIIEIYSSSRTIIIWPGGGQEGTHEAMELIKDIALLKFNDLELVDRDEPGVTCRIGHAKAFIETSYKTLEAITSLTSASYWTRVWVIQEASTPKDVTLDLDNDFAVWICCGSSTVTLNAFCLTHYRLIGRHLLSQLYERSIVIGGLSDQIIVTIEYLQYCRRKNLFGNPICSTLIRAR